MNHLSSSGEPLRAKHSLTRRRRLLWVGALALLLAGAGTAFYCHKPDMSGVDMQTLGRLISSEIDAHVVTDDWLDYLLTRPTVKRIRASEDQLLWMRLIDSGDLLLQVAGYACWRDFRNGPDPMAGLRAVIKSEGPLELLMLGIEDDLKNADWASIAPSEIGAVLATTNATRAQLSTATLSIPASKLVEWLHEVANSDRISTPDAVAMAYDWASREPEKLSESERQTLSAILPRLRGVPGFASMTYAYSVKSDHPGLANDINFALRDRTTLEMQIPGLVIIHHDFISGHLDECLRDVPPARRDYVLKLLQKYDASKE